MLAQIVLSLKIEKPPASIAVIFTNPIVENMDDVADDLPEYVNSFPTLVTSEFKKYIEANVKSGNEESKIGVDVVLFYGHDNAVLDEIGD